MNFCLSNFTVFSISEVMQFSVFLQKYCLVYYYELKSSQNSTLSELVSWLASQNSIYTELDSVGRKLTVCRMSN